MGTIFNHVTIVTIVFNAYYMYLWTVNNTRSESKFPFQNLCHEYVNMFLGMNDILFIPYIDHTSNGINFLVPKYIWHSVFTYSH